MNLSRGLKSVAKKGCSLAPLTDNSLRFSVRHLLAYGALSKNAEDKTYNLTIYRCK